MATPAKKLYHQGEQVIEMYLEAWKAEGQPIPEPNILQAV